MALYPRLLGAESPKISVHAIMAAVGEQERGKLTRAQVLAAFGITAQEEADYDALAAKVKPTQETYPLSGRVTLTNVGATYDANTDSQSLPFIYIQRAGVRRIDMELRVRKVGTGTQHWQLWDETNGVSVLDSDPSGGNNLTSGSLSDAGAAADRTLNGSRTFAQPLSPQVVKLRVRARSTTAADDPLYLQGSILLFREDTITSDVLHQVLLLAREGYVYTTEVDLKARLGIA